MVEYRSYKEQTIRFGNNTGLIMMGWRKFLYPKIMTAFKTAIRVENAGFIGHSVRLAWIFKVIEYI